MKTLKDKKIYLLSREKYIFEYKDVKQAVLEFKNELNSFGGTTPQFDEIMNNLKLRYKEIFGDLENE